MARFSKDDLKSRLTFADLDEDYLRQLIGLAKIEDLAGAGLKRRPEQLGDLTSMLMPEGAQGEATLNAREPLVVCGLPLVPLILESYGSECTFEALVDDGALLAADQPIGRLSGAAIPILQAERVLLNFLQHLSGIATETRLYTDALQGYDTILLDTRKTLPGYRVLQKYAFAAGGGYNHRIGLFDRIMLKDNHLVVAGSTSGSRLSDTVALAVGSVSTVPVQVEVDSISQIRPVLDAGADCILLDNFSLPELHDAVDQIGDSAATEASGGITLNTLSKIAETGVDFISTGAPIHQSRWKDIGLDWNV